MHILTMTSVSRLHRQVDLAALGFILLGGALYLGARLRMEQISRFTWRNPGPAGAVASVDQARYATYLAVVLIGVGCMVGLVGAVMHFRRK
jgi:hypothetical protein